MTRPEAEPGGGGLLYGAYLTYHFKRLSSPAPTHGDDEGGNGALESFGSGNGAAGERYFLLQNNVNGAISIIYYMLKNIHT